MGIITNHLWVWLVLLYGFLRGTRDIIKKKAMEKSSTMEVLFFYTLLSFLFVSYEGGHALKIDYSCMGLIAVKSFMVFVAWLCGFNALKKLPVSFFGVLDMSSVLFSTSMGIILLGEKMTAANCIGMVIVMFGLFMVNLKRQTASPNNEITFKFVSLAFLSYLFNAVSGVTDKILMKSVDSGQLQFWFMLLMTLMYLAFLLVTRTKVDIKCLWKNPWIILIAILFVIGDRALFYANGIPESQVTVMTLIKRCSCFVTIIGGAICFKEKNLLYRFCCAVIILAGIIVGLQ